MKRMKRLSRQAFIEKYQPHPFEGIEAGKNVILSEINKRLDREENGSFTHPLFSPEEVAAVMATITDAEQTDTYRRYVRLSQWTAKYSLYVKMFLDTGKALLFYTLEMFNHCVKMEKLEATIRGTASAEEIYKEHLVTFMTSDISRFTFVETDEFNTMRTRQSIADHVRMAHAFNKAIEIIAKEIKIPEFKYLQVDLSPIEHLLKDLLGLIDDMEQFMETSDYVEGDREIRLNTIKMFREAYSSIMEPTISKAAIAAARKQIKGLKVFTQPDNNIVNDLMAM